MPHGPYRSMACQLLAPSQRGRCDWPWKTAVATICDVLWESKPQKSVNDLPKFFIETTILPEKFTHTQSKSASFHHSHTTWESCLLDKGVHAEIVKAKWSNTCKSSHLFANVLATHWNTGSLLYTVHLLIFLYAFYSTLEGNFRAPRSFLLTEQCPGLSSLRDRTLWSPSQELQRAGLISPHCK